MIIGVVLEVISPAFQRKIIWKLNFVNSAKKMAISFLLINGNYLSKNKITIVKRIVPTVIYKSETLKTGKFIKIKFK